MDSHFKLTPDDIKIKSQDALDLFYAGIKAVQTRKTMGRLLKKFLLEVCADLLEGDYKQRARQFVQLAKKDQTKTTNIVIAYVKQLRNRTLLAKNHPSYINPSYVPNKIKPLKKLLIMNDVGLPWKRIQTYYPELDNMHKGRGYTRDEIKKLLEYSDCIETDFIILASSSGGLRVGGLDNQKWGNVFPIHEVNGEYKIELGEDETGIVVCGGMIIYKGSPEEYVALISIEAWEKLEEYKRKWTKKMQRPPKDTDPLILARFTNPVPLTANAIKERMEKLVVRSGLRTKTKGQRRYEIPVTHGFRRYWDKIMMQTKSIKGTLAALVIKERLFGHYGLVKTDKNYFWTDTLELVPEYLEAMPELMISDEYRLKHKLNQQIQKNEKLEQSNKEKELALRRLAELEVKMERIQKYQIIK